MANDKNAKIKSSNTTYNIDTIDASANDSCNEEKKISEKISENKISFEKAIARLEVIVRALEDGKCSLDESMKLYEEGVKLVRICNGALTDAKQKLTVISVDNFDN